MKFSEIPAGEVLTFVAPNIEAMICGAYRAVFYPDGRVVLVYTDESREEAQFSIEDAQTLAEKAESSIFPIVSAVQGKRKPQEVR